mmetsp:Transcript_123738/g.385338  ORF Transcript_123738/g.385338 Transcript_123738/m.385338 type:complete len:289 (-) Transcript_123738:350-1216(-)
MQASMPASMPERARAHACVRSAQRALLYRHAAASPPLVREPAEQRQARVDQPSPPLQPHSSGALSEPRAPCLDRHWAASSGLVLEDGEHFPFVEDQPFSPCLQPQLSRAPPFSPRRTHFSASCVLVWELEEQRLALVDQPSTPCLQPQASKLPGPAAKGGAGLGAGAAGRLLTMMCLLLPQVPPRNLTLPTSPLDTQRFARKPSSTGFVHTLLATISQRNTERLILPTARTAYPLSSHASRSAVSQAGSRPFLRPPGKSQPGLLPYGTRTRSTLWSRMMRHAADRRDQ